MKLVLQINAMINPLNSKLASVNATSILMRDDLSCVKTYLSTLNDSMKRVRENVKEHEDYMTAEMMKPNEYLKKSSYIHQSSSNNNHIIMLVVYTGGWRRAVYWIMTDTKTDFPSGWRELATPREHAADQVL